MSVCRPWEKAVMEVRKKWDLWGWRSGDRAGNQIIRIVLNSAQKVTFSRYPGMEKLIMSVAGVERPNLHALSLPKKSVDTATLSLSCRIALNSSL